MATQHFGCFRAFRAGSDMSGAGYRYRAMTLTAAGKLARAGAGDRVVGILTDAPRADEAGTIQVYDQATWEAGAAFNAGVPLASDASGRCVAAIPGDYVVATSSEAAGGAGHVVAVEIQSAAALAPVYLLLDIADGSADASYYLVAPVAGRITKLTSVIDGAVGTADITITPSIVGVPVTGGVVTIATAASAAGDVDTATPSAANVIAAGQAIQLAVAGGGSGGSPRLHVIVEITP